MILPENPWQCRNAPREAEPSSTDHSWRLSTRSVHCARRGWTGGLWSGIGQVSASLGLGRSARARPKRLQGEVARPEPLDVVQLLVEGVDVGLLVGHGRAWRSSPGAASRASSGQPGFACFWPTPIWPRSGPWSRPARPGGRSRLVPSTPWTPASARPLERRRGCRALPSPTVSGPCHQRPPRNPAQGTWNPAPPQTALAPTPRRRNDPTGEPFCNPSPKLWQVPSCSRRQRKPAAFTRLAPGRTGSPRWRAGRP